MVSRRLQAIRSLYLQSTSQFAKPLTKFVSLVAAKLSPLNHIGQNRPKSEPARLRFLKFGNAILPVSAKLGRNPQKNILRNKVRGFAGLDPSRRVCVSADAANANTLGMNSSPCSRFDRRSEVDASTYTPRNRRNRNRISARAAAFFPFRFTRDSTSRSDSIRPLDRPKSRQSATIRDFSQDSVELRRRPKSAPIFPACMQFGTARQHSDHKGGDSTNQSRLNSSTGESRHGRGIRLPVQFVRVSLSTPTGANGSPIRHRTCNRGGKKLHRPESLEMSILEEVKVCTRCACDQPLANFKRRSKSQGQRLSWCRDCVNESARQLTARKQTAALGQAVKSVRYDSSEAQIVAVVQAACHRFGGVEAFGRRLADLMESDDPRIAFGAMELLVCFVVAPVVDTEMSRVYRRACRKVKNSTGRT